MEITLIATADEAAFIVNVIGQLPTQSNAWPLFQKMKAQLEQQTQASAEAPPDAPAQ